MTRRLSARRRRQEGDDGVLPLVNVVFLLLIFFMVAGQLTRADPFEIAPPVSGSEGAAPDAPPTVWVGPEGQLSLGEAAMDEAALVAAVAGAAGASEAGVRVLADGRVEARRLVRLVAALRAAGVGEVTLMTVARGT
ncbi:hypothetical protein LNKW23_27440 [Paralimibaculum aggregatum]|uniref:Biopolymer transporter ExbD n=1 Tax=Paralimibaculum aggregatum TaxID=3036245 RepID=A0ABQ6LM60_9RHOB|nr:biopolymer transporter ExbD [Limibaculum sp. NKW23]GMG83531.1 hypothetical protein LNKW23_27440 [Limibaculum sp. NKW23]